MHSLDYMPGNDTALQVNFYDKAVEQTYESEQAGRPIFKTVTYIRIFFGGGKSELNCPAYFAKKRNDPPGHDVRFPLQWAAYKNKETVQTIGTPLDQWPGSGLKVSDVAELNYRGLFTVEQVASMTDQLASDMMHGINLRKKASLYLQAAAGQEPLIKLANENKELNSKLDALMKRIEAQEADNSIKEMPVKTSKKAG